VFGGVQAGILASTGIAFTAVDRWVHIGEWFVAISSVLLVVTLITQPEGIASGAHALVRKIRERRADQPDPAGVIDVDADARPVARRRAGAVGALEVRDLTVRYGGVTAVEDVDLTVEPGKVVGLIGPNGAGKTSVIDAITGFAGASGTIRLGDRDLHAVPTHARIRAGLARTFQSLELYDDLNVDENVSVAAFATNGADTRELVRRALSLTGIEALHDRAAGDLSQGERQLVSIARAYAAEPDILLLDEPAAGLDSGESQWLGGRIRAIAEDGTGVLLVDHDVALVLGVCDFVYVMDLGRVIAAGPPDDIRSNRAVAKAYLGGAPELTEAS
jgi:ABC-type branched-subunit amino acid transport system ATPase component